MKTDAAMFARMDGDADFLRVQVNVMRENLCAAGYCRVGDAIDAAIAMILLTARDQDEAAAHADYVIRELQAFRANLETVTA